MCFLHYNYCKSLSILEPDVAEPLAEFDEAMEVSEEQIEQSDEKKQEAIKAFSEQEHGKAAELYTEAIQMNPGKFSWTVPLETIDAYALHTDFMSM